MCSSDLCALAWSPNGAYLASAGDDMVVRIWNPMSGETCAVADCEPFRAGNLLAWLDSRMLISSERNKLFVWDAFSGQVQREITIPLSGWEPPDVYALSPHKHQLAVGVGVKVLLYSLASGEQIGWYEPPSDALCGSAYYQSAPTIVAWSPDGRRLATSFGRDPKRIFLWSAQRKTTLDIHQYFADVNCLDWAADSCTLAWGGDGYLTTAVFPHPASPASPPSIASVSLAAPESAEATRVRG